MTRLLPQIDFDACVEVVDFRIVFCRVGLGLFPRDTIFYFLDF